MAGRKSADLTPVWLFPSVTRRRSFFELILGKKEGKMKVKASTTFSIIGYTKMDLGIAKYHFEIGACKDNFEWA